MSGIDVNMKHLKDSAPYINAHRGKTFVVHCAKPALEEQHLESLVQDLSLLHNLGIKILLVFEATFDSKQPITQATLRERLGHIATQKMLIKARFSMGLGNSPMHGADIKICAGNFIVAKPKGIIEGIDYGHSGRVRKVKSEFIRQLLAQDCMLLLEPTGYSSTGEIFQVSSFELAREAAQSIDADKLIFMEPQLLKNTENTALREWVPTQADDLLQIQPNQQQLAQTAIQALQQGVERVHILDFHQPSAMLQELFSRDGCGSLITMESYESLRAATIDDIPGILLLIQPLETQKILVKRSREHLESEIAQFSVIERDGTLIGCAALHPFIETKIAEAACIAVHPKYQNTQRGLKLLTHIEQRAKTLGINRVFVLTTQATHWFVEQGYQNSTLDALPLERQHLYNYQRNSHILIKGLN